MVAINYIIRALILILGVILLLGLIKIPNSDPYIMKVMGVIFILWGIFRIITYNIKLKQNKQNDEE